MRQDLSLRLEQFKEQYVADETVRSRIAEPPVKFIGDEIMELAVAALLQGENVLITARRKNEKGIKDIGNRLFGAYDVYCSAVRSTLCRSM